VPPLAPPHRPTVDDGGGDDWLTRNEAADYARVSLATIDRAVHDGELQSSKPRRRMRRFRRSWIDAWLAGGVFAWYLLGLAFALSLVCYCHAMHVAHGAHCIVF